MARCRTVELTIRGIDSMNTCSTWSGINRSSRPVRNLDTCRRTLTTPRKLLKSLRTDQFVNVACCNIVRMRYKESDSLFGGLLDDEGSFLHGSRSHRCWSLGLATSSQFELPTPSRIHRTSLVCTPVPHVTEHWKIPGVGIYIDIYTGICIAESSKPLVAGQIVNLRDLPSTSSRWTMSVCTRSLCILARLLASSRCNCSPATRRIRCSSLRRKGLLDIGHPHRKTPNTETIFVGACSIETIAADRWRCLVVGEDPTNRERVRHIYIYIYSVFGYLLLTNVHGPVNHFALSQFGPLPKHCLSVSGLSLGLQNSSLPSAQATRLVSTPLPHSAEHWIKDKETRFQRMYRALPFFLLGYWFYLGRPFRVKPRCSMLHTGVYTRRRFASFLRLGFVEHGTSVSRRDAGHRTVTSSHPARCRTLES